MNPELEGLVLALDAVIQARRGDDAQRLDAIYQARLEEVLARCPGLSRERLVSAVDFAHQKWRNVQDKKPTPMPPRA